MTNNTLRLSRLHDIEFFKRGKVRDVYDLGDNLLIVSTDRISCFDVVLPTDIPRKGEVLNHLSLFWFQYMKDIISNHLITADVNAYKILLIGLRKININNLISNSF